MSNQKAKKIGIVIGSQSDFKLFIPTLEKLKEMDIGYEFTIASAHRTPERLRDWVKKMEQSGVEVIIAGAGAAAHLPGVVASQTLIPVIGVPLDTTHLRGVDALYSIVQMPKGVPVATVGINNVENAMLLALHILGIKYPEIRGKLSQYKNKLKADVIDQMGKLREEYPHLVEIAEEERKNTATKTKNSAPVSEIPLGTQNDEEILAKLEREFVEHSRRIEQERALKAKQEIEVKEQRYSSIDSSKKPRIIPVDPLQPDAEAIEEAAMVLLEGGIVAFPTDTVYGIAADATNSAAVERLFELKKREHQKAIPVLIHSTNQLRSIVKKIPESAKLLMERYWPGALTIVFEKYENTFMAVSSGTTLGIRIPDNLVCLSVLSMTGRPLATTSANISGKAPAVTADKVVEYFGSQIDLIIDGGHTSGETVSTVLSVVSVPFEILREGRISRAELLDLLGKDFIK